MLDFRNNRYYLLILSTIIIVLDQLTKYLIDTKSISLLNKDLIFFKFDYVRNFGAAFNLFSGNRFLLSFLSVLVSIILLYIISTNKIINNIELLSYSFILGGTIGNGIDRLSKGFVIDFINLNFINFPVFNIADISINIGLIFIIYGLIRFKR